MRATVAGFSGLNVVVGLWLIVAPWALHYGASDREWNDRLFGAVIVILAAARAGGAFRESWLSIGNALVGAWLVIAAFTIDATTTATVNDVVFGTTVFILATGSAAASASRLRSRR